MLNDLLKLFFAQLVQELFVKHWHLRLVLELLLLVNPLVVALFCHLLLLHQLLLLHSKKLFLLFWTELVEGGRIEVLCHELSGVLLVVDRV